MPENFSIVGIARSEYADGEYKKHLKEGIDNFSRKKRCNGEWEEFSKHISYMQMDVTDEAHYERLQKLAKEKKQNVEYIPTLFFTWQWPATGSRQ